MQQLLSIWNILWWAEVVFAGKVTTLVFVCFVVVIFVIIIAVVVDDVCYLSEIFCDEQGKVVFAGKLATLPCPLSNHCLNHHSEHSVHQGRRKYKLLLEIHKYNHRTIQPAQLLLETFSPSRKRCWMKTFLNMILVCSHGRNYYCK